MVILKITIRLELETPLHIVGNKRLWGVDKAAARAPDGAYIIPATAFKGFLRDRAEAVLRTWNVKVCLGPEPDTMCPDPQRACPVCRVFGNPRLTTPLKFRDLRTSATIEQIRSGVALSRYRRAVASQRLFFLETIHGSFTPWWGRAQGWFASSEEAKEAAALLRLAAQAASGYALGGGRTRGLGWIRSLKLETVLDETPLFEDDFHPIWSNWAGGEKVEYPMVADKSPRAPSFGTCEAQNPILE